MDDAAGRDTIGTAAPKRRRFTRARAVLLALGAAGVIAAVALPSVLSSDGGTPSDPVTQAASAGDPEVSALRYLGDPGNVYDRRVVVRPTPSPRPTATPVPAVGEPLLRDVPYQLVIDSIGVNAPVGIYGLDAYGAPLVPLNGGEVAWYDWSAQPGTGSNAVFAGHVTWSGAAVFYNLNTISAGDVVRLIGQDGTELVYTVEESFLVDPNDPDALSVMSPTDEDVVTIITCDGSFFYTGDPVFRGDYTSRRVVKAGLTEINAPATGNSPL